MHHAAQALHLGYRLLERGQQHFDIAPVLVHGVEQPHTYAVSLQGPYGLGPQALRLVQRMGDAGYGRAGVVRFAASGTHHCRLSPPLTAWVPAGPHVIGCGPAAIYTHPFDINRNNLGDFIIMGNLSYPINRMWR
ncbi:hypothetical protein GCM10010317_098360 [Streptomyces mirabilis]|nr:hypothetical protein GCM10010317_098360 [Streptomyces mirabilis]